MNTTLFSLIAIFIVFIYAYKHPQDTGQVFWGMVVGSIAGVAIGNLANKITQQDANK